MSVAAHTLSRYRDQLRSNRLGLWLFFISEAFLFAGLLITRFYLWGGTRPDLDQVTGLIITSILLLSSFFMYTAEVAAEHGNRRTFLFSLIMTALLGTAFLVGVAVFEWGGHIRPWDGAFGAVLFGMTGMHALHVASGIVFILIVWPLDGVAENGEAVPVLFSAEACPAGVMPAVASGEGTGRKPALTST